MFFFFSLHLQITFPILKWYLAFWPICRPKLRWSRLYVCARARHSRNNHFFLSLFRLNGGYNNPSQSRDCWRCYQYFVVMWLTIQACDLQSKCAIQPLFVPSFLFAFACRCVCIENYVQIFMKECTVRDRKREWEGTHMHITHILSAGSRNSNLQTASIWPTNCNLYCYHLLQMLVCLRLLLLLL